MKQKLFSARALLCVVAFALCAKASAADLRFALPPETATFKTGPGVEVAKTQCLVCHSADYISTQPRLPRAFWKANIEKMKAKYGGLEVSDARRLRQLEDENGKLKRLLADSMLDSAILKDLLGKV